MLLTQDLLNRLPNWIAAGWLVGDTVNMGDFNCQCDAIANKILTGDSFASFYNNHPPHHP